MLEFRLPPEVPTGAIRTVYVVTRPNYAVRQRRLLWDDPYWRDLGKGTVYFYEQVFESEQEALLDCLMRARIRRDELDDAIRDIEGRLDALALEVH